MINEFSQKSLKCSRNIPESLSTTVLSTEWNWIEWYHLNVLLSSIWGAYGPEYVNMWLEMACFWGPTCSRNYCFSVWFFSIPFLSCSLQASNVRREEEQAPTFSVISNENFSYFKFRSNFSNNNKIVKKPTHTKYDCGKTEERH